MTSPHDDTPTPGWTSPTNAPGPGWTGAPATGPGYGPGYQNTGYGPAYQPPAVQPGIVPLRPLGLGEILDGAFRAIRANPRVMFGLTALVVSITVAVQSVAQWYLAGIFSGAMTDTTAALDPTGQLNLAAQTGPLLAEFATIPALTLATTVLTGLLIVSVSRSVLGRTVTIGEVWHGYRGRVGLVLVFSIGLGLAETLVLAALAGLVALAAADKAIGVAVVLGLVFGLAAVVGSIWLMVRTLLIPPAIMLEGGGLRSSISRGWRLSRGSFWRLLGIYLLTSIIVSVVGGLIATPASILTQFIFKDPTMSSVPSLAVVGVAHIIGLTLTTVFSAAVVALLYVDVRMRREGLDVELARAAGQSVA